MNIRISIRKTEKGKKGVGDTRGVGGASYIGERLWGAAASFLHTTTLYNMYNTTYNLHNEQLGVMSASETRLLGPEHPGILDCSTGSREQKGKHGWDGARDLTRGIGLGERMKWEIDGSNE